MKRTIAPNNSFPVTTDKPIAIATADWHLREDTPSCRVDDFPVAQWLKVKEIADLQYRLDCPVLHAGDLFHHWKPSPYLLSQCIRYMPDQFFTVYGNHDLPQHNIELHEKSGIHTLASAGKIFVLDNGHWNDTPNGIGKVINGKRFLVWHVMVWHQEEPYPGCPAPRANKLLKQYPEYDYIITGDNHTPFVFEFSGRALINPGCLTRQTADLTHFKPRVYIIYPNRIEPYYLSVKNDVISRDHIDKKVERDSRLDAFISKLNTDWQISLSFEENMRRFAEVNQVRSSVMEIIWNVVH